MFTITPLSLFFTLAHTQCICFMVDAAFVLYNMLFIHFHVDVAPKSRTSTLKNSKRILYT